MSSESSDEPEVNMDETDDDDDDEIDEDKVTLVPR
jgi:hypothetical protein